MGDLCGVSITDMNRLYLHQVVAMFKYREAQHGR